MKLTVSFGGFEIEPPKGLKFTGDQALTEVFSALLPYIFVIAGLLLLGAIIIAGFQFLTSAGEPKKTAQAKGCLTDAVVGFLVIFISYWLIQIIEIIFNIKILGE